MMSPRDRHRRLSFSAALVALITLVTGVTGAVLGGLAWYEKRAAARALTDAAMTQAARLTVDYAERLFRGAEPAARLGPLLVAQHMLTLAKDADVERFVLATLT